MIQNNVPAPEDNELDLSVEELKVLLTMPEENLGKQFAEMLSIDYITPAEAPPLALQSLLERNYLLIDENVVRASTEINIFFSILTQAHSYMNWSAVGGPTPSHHKIIIGDTASLAMYAIAPNLLRFMIVPPDFKIDFFFENYLKEYESYTPDARMIQVSAVYYSLVETKAVNAFHINHLWEVESGVDEGNMTPVDSITTKEDFIAYVKEFFQ